MSRIVNIGVTCIMPHTNMIAVSLVQERFLWFAKLIKLELTLNFICINVYVLQVMVCTAVVLVVSAFFLCITEQLSPYYKVHGTQGQQDFQHSFWYMFGALLTQGTLQPKLWTKINLRSSVESICSKTRLKWNASDVWIYFVINVISYIRHVYNM